MATEHSHDDPQQTQPEHMPLLFRLPTPIAILILALSLATPVIWAAFAHWHPLGGIVGAPLALVAYVKLRHGGRSFGPLWLELVDMIVLFGNLITFVLSCVAFVRAWH